MGVVCLWESTTSKSAGNPELLCSILEPLCKEIAAAAAAELRSMNHEFFNRRVLVMLEFSHRGAWVGI